MTRRSLLVQTLAAALAAALCCGAASTAQTPPVRKPKATAAPTILPPDAAPARGQSLADTVPGDVAYNLNSQLDQLASALRTVCTDGTKIAKTKPDDPQLPKLQSDLVQLGATTIGPSKLVDPALPNQPSTLSFSQFCDEEPPQTDSRWGVDTSHKYKVSRSDLQQLLSTVRNLGEVLPGIVGDINASDDLVKAAGGPADKFATDLQTVWTGLKGVSDSLASVSLSLKIKLGDLPPIKSPAPGIVTPPGPSLLDRLKSGNLLPLALIALNLALLCLLGVILVKIRKREVVELNPAQASALESTSKDITSLTEKVSNLGTSVEKLLAALENSAKTPPPPSPQPTAPALEEEDFLKKLERLSRSDSAEKTDQPAGRHAHDDPFAPAAGASAEGAAGQLDPLQQFLSSAGPRTPQPTDPPSGDLVLDYNRGRTNREMEDWFYRHHPTTAVSCQNLHLAHNPSISLRFVQDPKGNFLAVTEGGVTKAFPGFRRDLYRDSAELEGVFTYRGSHEPLELVEAATLREVGIGEWERVQPGVIQNA